MKTKYTLLAAFLFMAHAGFAQFDFGLKAGTNISKIDGKSFSDEFRYGYSAGGFVNIGLGKKLGIQPELLFNQAQTQVDSNFKAIYMNAFRNSSSGEVKLNYLAIPVMINYKLGKSLALQAGPQYSILLNKDKNLLENGKSAFSEGEFSLHGGAQLTISRFLVSGRYGIGLNDLNDAGNQSQWKSQTIQVAVGLSF